MRNAFCAAMVALGSSEEILFFTGDLGFMALEPLQAALGPRFINAGVAEQNMVSVAAGAASQGEQCWAYSIAPFMFARPFEQIRNDVCLHDFNVKLVGNGGGYGYGVMGATHHALEDYGVMATLQNMRIDVPAVAADVAPAVARMAAHAHPAYLRLGRCEKPAGWTPPDYAPWRKLLSGEKGILLMVGPGVGGVLSQALSLDEAARPEIWVVSELPFGLLPDEFLAGLAAGRKLTVAEEHVAQGGIGQILALELLKIGMRPAGFQTICAQGYRSGRYGSQAFHRLENGLDAASILARVG